MIHPPNYTISKKHNSYIWLPAKTASNTLSWILAHYDFEKFIFDQNNELILDHNLVHFGHANDHPKDSENMIFLCSLRNPYERYFSFFKSLHRYGNVKITKDNFINFIENEFEKKQSVVYRSWNIFEERKPDYIIRTESIYSDLIKIPFIKNSRVNECGILEEMCNKKIWASMDINSESYFSPEIKEKIFNLFQSHFELGGYEK